MLLLCPRAPHFLDCCSFCVARTSGYECRAIRKSVQPQKKLASVPCALRSASKIFPYSCNLIALMLTVDPTHNQNASIWDNHTQFHQVEDIKRRGHLTMIPFSLRERKSAWSRSLPTTQPQLINAGVVVRLQGFRDPGICHPCGTRIDQFRMQPFERTSLVS